MAGARRRQADRAIIYGGVLGGMTRAEVNTMLESVGARELPESSYQSIRKHYLPYLVAQLAPRLGNAIKSPPTWSDLAATDPSVGGRVDGDPTEDL